jgi:hypothetical protein
VFLLAVRAQAHPFLQGPHGPQGQEIEERRGPDSVDVESTRAIREATTEASFLTEWVDYVPQSDTVPSPRDFLGYAVGTGAKLTSAARIVAYFKELARTSDRVQVLSMGTSHGGREMIVAAIGDAELLARIPGIRAGNRSLADPRGTSKAEAQEIAATLPVTYYITAGLHSPETGPPEMVMELAYRLAVSEADHIREIRAQVLTLITPVLEMDGRERTVDWHNRYLQGYTELEDTPPRSAPYWGDYTFHDNNRDGLQVSQPLTRNFVGMFHEFLPTVSLDLHESVPLLYVSTGTGPYNETIDPIAITEWQWMASYDVSLATRMGLRGVWTWAFYTGWYPGYLLWVTNNHNSVGRFYETFGNSLAGTFARKLKDSRFADERVNARAWYRAWPPEKELRWSLRNNTNYMQTGVLAALQLAARNSDTLLMNFWQKGFNSLEKGRTQAPFAFHVPAEQRDKAKLHHLLWLLDRHAIEVHQAADDVFLAEGVTIPAGNYVVRMDQPYRNFAKTLLAKQDFPKNAAHTPYDDVAWSLDYMLGLEIEPVNDKTVFQGSLTRLEEIPDLPGDFEAGSKWIVDHRGQANLAGLRWALGDGDVRALSKAWESHPAGSLIIAGADAQDLEALARSFHVDVRALDPGTATPETVEVDLPRVALYHTWTYTQDSGWARYTLEQLRIPYTLIAKDDLRAGDLSARFDVIVVPDQGGRPLKAIVHGIDTKWGPMPYTRTQEFASHGVIDSAEDITGGMGFEGLGHLDAFVRSGGLLITLGGSGVLAADSGIAREVTSHPPSGTPGSHVSAKVLRPEHPVTWGFEPVTHVFHGNERHFTVPEYWQGMVVMQYGTRTRAEAEREADRKDGVELAEAQPDNADEAGEGPGEKKPELCLSGSVPDPSALERKPALLDVPVGKGRVLLFTWNPLHRYQNHHDFTFLTNALLFHDDFPSTPTEREMRAREAAE